MGSTGKSQRPVTLLQNFNCNPKQSSVKFSVADPDPPDPHVFGPPGSTSQRYGSDPDPSIIMQK